MVQAEFGRRATVKHSGVSIFAGKIKCSCCGSFYGAKKWHSTSKYARTIYQCNAKFKNKCDTPHLYEADIKRHFISAANKLFADKSEIIENFKLIRKTLFDFTALEIERSAFKNEMSVVADLVQQCVDENARSALDQLKYAERYNALTERYESAKAQFAEIETRIADKKARAVLLDSFIAELQNRDGLLTEHDSEVERLWCSLVDCMVVCVDGVRVVFKNGVEV